MAWQEHSRLQRQFAGDHTINGMLVSYAARIAIDNRILEMLQSPGTVKAEYQAARPERGGRFGVGGGWYCFIGHQHGEGVQAVRQSMSLVIGNRLTAQLLREIMQRAG